MADETTTNKGEIIEIKTLDTHKRQRVNRIKTAIIVFLIIMFLLPTLLCLWLGVRIYRLENQVSNLLSTYSSKTEAKEQPDGNGHYAYASETNNHVSTGNDLSNNHDSDQADDSREDIIDKQDIIFVDDKIDDDSIINDNNETDMVNENTISNNNFIDDSSNKGDSNAEPIVQIDETDMVNKNDIYNNDYIDDSSSKGEVDAEPIVKTDEITEAEEIVEPDYRDPDGIYYGKKVYLTFDDGPTKNTEMILDILLEYDVKATFFVVGFEDDKAKELYRRIVNEGHTLGVHSYSHDYSQIYNSIEDFDKDFTKLCKLLYDTTGYMPTIYRFPGGSQNFVERSKMKKFIRYINEKGMTYYDWNVLNGDAEGKDYTEEQMIDNVLNGVARKKNSIVLMHDGLGKKKTVDTLPAILEALISNGAEILPIDEDAPVIQQIKATSVNNT